jgi:Ran GTPase-activating protein 1
MAPNSKIFSLEGKGLKLDTKEDVEKHIKALREMQDVEEVRLLGNTLGVEACKILGEVLETKKTLQVGFHVYNESVNSRTCADRLFARSQT